MGLRRLSRGFTLFVLLLAFLQTTQGADPLPAALEEWMYYETTLNDKDAYQAPSREHSALKRQYRSQGGDWFEAKSYWIPESELNVATAEKLLPSELQSHLMRTVQGQRQYRLFVHPESETFYLPLTSKHEFAGTVQVRATASGRTSLVRLGDNPPQYCFVKFSLDVKLGKSIRTISRAESVQSVGISKYISSRKKELSDTFQFIAEPLGVIPKGWARGGQIIRPVPSEILQNKTHLVPLFSLTAPQPDGSTLFERMARKSGLDPYTFARERILRPFLKGWTEWAIDGGLSMAAHSQNVLIELNNEGNPTGRFFHRDMGGMNLDLESPGARRFAGSLPVFSTLASDYHQDFRIKARETSIKTYFQNRFLYNIDKDVSRLVSTYPKGKLLSDLWVELGESIRNHSLLPMDRTTPSQLQNALSDILKDAQSNKRNKRCLSWFRSLISN